MSKAGIFVISLDFELLWGVRDTHSLQQYGRNLLGARKAIPQILDLFRAFQIHATWATVGLLFCRTRDELLASLPADQPTYREGNLSPYCDLAQIGTDEDADPYHFGASLIRAIQGELNQEIATHTFSHYYCGEPGQNSRQFGSDLNAAIESARRFGVMLQGIVFPRNQIGYLEICRQAGLTAYRGNEKSWLYAGGTHPGENIVRRGLRLLDAYLNLTGSNTHHPTVENGMVNVTSSRFLRPYTPRLQALEGRRLRRITRAITHAAKRGEVYHLWWHPHNFGAHTESNLAFLRSVLEHFAEMRDTYGMRSRFMGEVAAEVISPHEPQSYLQMA